MSLQNHSLVSEFVVVEDFPVNEFPPALTGAMLGGWAAKTSGKSSMNIWRWLQAWQVRRSTAAVPDEVADALHRKRADVTEKELRDEEEEEEDERGREGPCCDVIESGEVGVLFLEQLKLNSDPYDRTDFPNFRGLLWRAMAQFPDRVEARSRELSPLLLRFIRWDIRPSLLDGNPSSVRFTPRSRLFCSRNEFYPADLLVAPTQDLRKLQDAAVEESDKEEELEEEVEEETKRPRKALPRRAAAK